MRKVSGFYDGDIVKLMKIPLRISRLEFYQDMQIPKSA